jgi:tetratricopeptide (TPR) repeat protein
MSRVLKGVLSLLIISLFGVNAYSDDSSNIDNAEAVKAQVETYSETVDALQEPLYTPFIERYVLDELKQLRSEMASQKHEIMQQILDREHSSVDRAVAYATDTVTYFFYLVAAASSILVIVGWTSIREIKERVHSYANDEITKLINEYESRLGKIEKQLLVRTRDIEENREEIEVTREVQSLWLRSQQELNPSSKILIYDKIISISPGDIEAFTYKADAVLELNEPQWAINLCQLALEQDSENAHAFFQLACAYASLGNLDESLKYALKAYHCNENYRDEIVKEVLLEPLKTLPEFKDKFS